MGHSRIGTLPATLKWKEVVRLVANGADEAKVADAVMDAVAGTFARARDDAGFREAIRLVTQMALAGGRPDALAELGKAGIEISKNPSLAEVVMAIGEEFDRRVDASRRRSDFAEIAHRALVAATTEHFGEHLHSLFDPSRAEVGAAFKQLSKQGNFGKFFRGFVGELTSGFLSMYLSRTLGTHLGEGQRFATTERMGQFEKALKTHCHEASKIVEQFAGEWLSLNRYKGAGEISPEKAEGFGWVAFRKMTLELAERARKDGH